MRQTIVAATLPALLALPAFAGNLEQPIVEEVVVAPAPVVAPGYDWSGFYAGLSLGTGSGEVDNGTVTNDFDVDTSYGLYGGYLWDGGNIVYGGELDYSSLDITDKATNNKVNGDVIRLKGRLGYDAGRVLPYATVGLANATIDNESGSGYVYGVGMEFAATDSVRVRGEYLAHDFQDFGNTNSDVKMNTFNLGLSYNF